MRVLFSIVMAAAIVGWLALFLSSSAVLFWGEIVGPKNQGDQATLSCQYFTGVGTFTRSYWYNENGVMGRSACPRLVSL